MNIALDADCRRLLDRIAPTLRSKDPRMPISPSHPLGVAYSGGVDSAALVAAAAAILGPDAVRAILGVSASLARREHRSALEVANHIGVTVIEVTTREIDDARYRSNGIDRCYYCKSELFERLDEASLAGLGLAALAFGENADDARRPDRPGSQAATEHHVLRPLAEAGLSKDEVRALARGLGLSVADKPASPCLASRIPHGDPVTTAKLRQIDQAEDAVFAAGFTDVRVRHHGTVARIEVPVDEFELLADEKTRNQLVDAITRVGFQHVALDLSGIQSGAFTLSLLQIRKQQ